jgi:hypothetical protein
MLAMAQADGDRGVAGIVLSLRRAALYAFAHQSGGGISSLKHGKRPFHVIGDVGCQVELINRSRLVAQRLHKG